MSLHIGNLSSHTRRDDLERVFRRFGRCTIQIKDKYGFVVYDYPASAEKALKILRGTRICGQAITLSWSKQQPRAPQRFPRGGKSYEPPRRRHHSVKEISNRGVVSDYRQDHEMDSKKADGEVRHELVYVGENDQTSLSDLKNLPEDDRWGEQVVDPTNDFFLENGMEFDRYEPHHSEGKKELDESEHVSPFSRSPCIRMSTERKGNTYDRISEKNSRRRLSPRKGFGDNKRNRRDYESRDKNYLKGAKGPSSSSIHSEYTSSRSRSRSRSRSPSKSKSVPSKKISRSSSLRSSPSCNSRTKSFNSQSTSRSKSPNSSFLPVEQPTRDLSRSPVERQKESKNSMQNDVSIARSKDLFEEETLTFKSEINTSVIENDFDTKPDELEHEDLKKDLSEKDNEHCHSVEDSSCELLESHVPQSHTDGHINDNSIRDSKNEVLVGERILAPEFDISVRPNASNLSRISSQEMCMVLKHYGLPYPGEKEKDSPAETYFGSARMWPWEMIYYRRLKRGSISAENYARRIAQNQEFGIVDKYIRGCSGWRE